MFKKLLRIPGWMVGLFVGVLCLTLGAYYDQFSDIFRKAVMICLECIGIGQEEAYEEIYAGPDPDLVSDIVYDYNQRICLWVYERKDL